VELGHPSGIWTLALNHAARVHPGRQKSLYQAKKEGRNRVHLTEYKAQQLPDRQYA
jgi:hypothetical protein